jgi:hypothetical protein
MRTTDRCVSEIRATSGRDRCLSVLRSYAFVFGETRLVVSVQITPHSSEPLIGSKQISPLEIELRERLRHAYEVRAILLAFGRLVRPSGVRPQYQPRTTRCSRLAPHGNRRSSWPRYSFVKRARGWPRTGRPTRRAGDSPDKRFVPSTPGSPLRVLQRSGVAEWGCSRTGPATRASRTTRANRAVTALSRSAHRHTRPLRFRFPISAFRSAQRLLHRLLDLGVHRHAGMRLRR